jgi:hypothetical protein
MDWGFGEGDKSDMRARLVSETISISGGDYPYPGEPNRCKVQFRLRLQSLGYIQGLFCHTSTSLGFGIYFFQIVGEIQRVAHESCVLSVMTRRSNTVLILQPDSLS